jgi:cyclophilin family peptidyl-prolyl cis-trans isomerase
MSVPTVTKRGLTCLVMLAWLVWTGCGGGHDVPAANIAAPRDAVASSGTVPHGQSDPVTLVASGGEFQSPARSTEQLRPEVLIQTNLGAIRLQLDWEKAPRTVANFLYNYVETEFYDQTVFHHVESGYLIAGGGYTVDLREKATQPPIPCEADNGLSNRRGTVAMARHPGFAASATSQYFINLVDNPGLDYQPGHPDGINGYCVFGQVIEGLEVVDQIAQVPVQDSNGMSKTPVTPVVVESIRRVK